MSTGDTITLDGKGGVELLSILFSHSVLANGEMPEKFSKLIIGRLSSIE